MMAGCWAMAGVAMRPAARVRKARRLTRLLATGWFGLMIRKLPRIGLAELVEKRLEITLRPVQHLVEAVLHGNRQPHALEVYVGHVEAARCRGQPPPDLLAPAALQLDGAQDDGVLALLGVGIDFELVA